MAVWSDEAFCLVKECEFRYFFKVLSFSLELFARSLNLCSFLVYTEGRFFSTVGLNLF